MPDLQSPTLGDLEAHGTNVGPGERYYWYNNALWVVAAMPSNQDAENLVETFDMVPGERMLHPGTHKVFTVRKSRIDARTCEVCSRTLHRGVYYGASTGGDTICLRCLTGAEDVPEH
jgi:hypothetical protein